MLLLLSTAFIRKVKKSSSVSIKNEKVDDVFLNLVMDYIPETVHRTLRTYAKAKKLIPIMYTKVYMYQIARSLAYIHSLGICHSDIKPQNSLLNSRTHEVKPCDFGSAKVLVKGEPNVAYICSRYYRAPEQGFEATEYSTAIDIWSMGCVMAELLLGKPLFPGESAVDQLIEIIKILGTPTKEQIQAMNPNHTSFKFPQIRPHPWSKVFRSKAQADAIDLVSKFLHYEPSLRIHPFDALAHQFFDELREPHARLPNGKPLPNLFNFTDSEIKMASERGLLKKLLPPEILKKVMAPKTSLTPAPTISQPPTSAPTSSSQSQSQSQSQSSISSSTSTSSPSATPDTKTVKS